MLEFKTAKLFKSLSEKRGRDAMFKCAICGRFVSYDRRTVNIKYYTDSIFERYEEQWFPEEMIEYTHKKCEVKNEK